MMTQTRIAVTNRTICYELYKQAGLASAEDTPLTCLSRQIRVLLNNNSYDKILVREKDLSVEGPMHAIMVIFEIVGVVLGVFVLYLIINMIVAETATNISVMKVLGFSQKEISNRVLNVNHILVCIGYLIGIPVAYMFVKVGYSDTIENYGMLLSPVLTARTLVIGFVLTWVVYEISLLLQKQKISRIDMVEALKENNRNE